MMKCIRPGCNGYLYRKEEFGGSIIRETRVCILCSRESTYEIKPSVSEISGTLTIGTTNSSSSPQYVEVHEAADMLGTTPRNVWRAAKREQIHFERCRSRKGDWIAYDRENVATLKLLKDDGYDMRFDPEVGTVYCSKTISEIARMEGQPCTPRTIRNHLGNTIPSVYIWELKFGIGSAVERKYPKGYSAFMGSLSQATTRLLETTKSASAGAIHP